MRLLILGGTIFLGRHLTEAALARGHAVTLFNRGRHGPDLFPEAEKLRGDRKGDLAILAGRRWDAVIDTSGYLSESVAASAGLLADAVDRYAFISTISVYADTTPPGVTEDAPLADLRPGMPHDRVTGETYGPLKALCERAVEAALPGGRSLIVRPGLIVGPHDPTGRFTSWPVRVARGGEVLAPGSPAAPVQFIDARDLAAWTLDLIEAGTTGIFNATGPVPPITFGDLLDACRRVAAPDARLTWVDEEFLIAAGVTPWVDLPLWIPAQEGEAPGFLRIDVRRAVTAGLRFRPIEETVRDTLRWAEAGGTAVPPAGLTADREQQILDDWHRQARSREG